MTCVHVLGLIDAGPFADYPPAHRAAAREHARHCPTCGPALQAAAALTTDLAALAQTAAPPDLARIVLARIAQIEQAPSAPAAAALLDTRTASMRPDWSEWAATIGGLAAGLAVLLSMPPVGGVVSGLTSPRVGVTTAALVSMPATTASAILVAAGLLLYLAGLFAPLGVRRGERDHWWRSRAPL